MRSRYKKVSSELDGETTPPGRGRPEIECREKCSVDRKRQLANSCPGPYVVNTTRLNIGLTSAWRFSAVLIRPSPGVNRSTYYSSRKRATEDTSVPTRC